MVPASPRFIAYYRVSTQRQGQSGLGMDAQRAAVDAYLAQVGGRLIESFDEIESGRKKDRPQLLAAIRKAKLTRAVLVIAKLDRLARNYHFLRQLQEAGVKFVCCDMPQANELTIHILAAVAEDEAKQISSRTKAALAAAKARGVKLGGDRVGIAAYAARGALASAEARSLRAGDWASEMLEVIDAIRSGGQSTLREIANELNLREFQTARGGLWSATQVKRVMDRAA